MNSDDLEQLPFFRHGRDPNCDPEIAHTIVELMDHVEHNWADDDEKQRHGYQANVNPARLAEAWALLRSKPSFTLHGFGPRKKITSLVPLAGMPALEGLFLAWNSIEDISPLAGVPRLRSLSLKENQVGDISVLASCRQLVDLDLSENPVRDLSPLDGLPALRKLTLSTSQALGLVRCKTLPALMELVIHGEGSVPPLADLPSMPQLRRLELRGVTSLAGIDRYPLVESLDFNGEDYDLSAVTKLRHLVAATFWSKGSFDVAALSQCSELRFLSLVSSKVTGLEALEELPHLHEVHLGRETHFDRDFAKRLREKLPPWDAEFGQPIEAFVPQLQVEVVSQAEFDRWHIESFGVAPERFEALLPHERDWLLERIEKAVTRIGLRVENNGKTDLVIPYGGSDKRSHQVAVTSRKSYRAFGRLVVLIQQQLNMAGKEWAIFCNSVVTNERQSRRVKDFEVWILRDKLVTTEKYAATVQALLDAKPRLLDRVSTFWRR